MGQFERTLIIVDEGAYVHYVEGCTAPIYSSDSLHSAVVEIIVKPRGRCRYTTIQNWSTNVYNLVTKRAVAYEDATMEWVDGNLGSKLTMKYPAIWLMGERAHGEVLSIAFAGTGQHQDAGGKVVHVAPNTTSVITSKSISKNGGRAGYRGLLKVAQGRTGSKSKVVCDALILDDESRSDTYPYIQIDENEVDIGHEATVSKIGEEQLFYLMSPRALRGGGLRDDRLRLRRADHQGAPAGVRGRDEPADPAPDGRLRRLIGDERRLRRVPSPTGAVAGSTSRRSACGPTRPARASSGSARRARIYEPTSSDGVRAAATRTSRCTSTTSRRRGRARGKGVEFEGEISTPASATWRSSRSRRQRAHAPPPLQLARERVIVERTTSSRAGHGLERSTAWYRDRSGCRRSARALARVPARRERQPLPDRPDQHRPRVHGPNHGRSRCASPTSRSKRELEGRGIEFDGELDTGVCHMAFFRDPDGNALMLHRRYAPP